MRISLFLTLFSTENLQRVSNSLYRAQHNFYNKYFLLSLSIKRPSFLTLIPFIACPTGMFGRLISDAKGPILNFALITLVAH